MTTIRALVVFAAILMALGCGRQRSGRTITQPNGEQVVSVTSDDAIMNEAIGKGRLSMPHFMEELKNPKDRKFGIKAKFVNDRHEIEYMWISRLSYKNGIFHGELCNEPFHIAKLHLTDKVDVKSWDVIDWSITDGDKSEGAFTEKALEQIPGNK